MGGELSRRTRQKLRREDGAIIKDWGGRFPIALIYPNSYYLGMSNLGFQTIYGLLNAQGSIVCERFFWEGEGRPLALESGRPLDHFSLLAFSISYELDYFNVLQVLKSAGIPVLAQDRDERHPLVIAGGPCITANPLPLSPFFDALAIGEAEAILPPFLDVLREGESGSRSELFQAIASVPGLYVPALDARTRVSRQWALDLDSFATTSVVLTPDTELGDMFLMEVARGCARGCRFCMAGHHFKPLRTRSLANLLAQGEAGLARGRRLGLVGASVSDHPDIGELATRLRARGAQISVSSLRVDALPQGLLQALAESGTRMVTLAPEAGSEALRRAIGKPISTEVILRAIRRVGALGFPELKLYFLVGLPGENDEDIWEIARLILQGKKELERLSAPTRIVANINPFVPKAGTPFQALPMAQLQVLKGRLRLARSLLAKAGVDIRGEGASWSLIQGLLARGDARLGLALARLAANKLSAWRKTLEGMDTSWLHRELALAEQPWAFLSAGSAKMPEEVLR
ncbi:MAG: radical SAM protein [Chloroflexi bacterium]|nr:radical SAM protein [Chloroflexota bacterium]